MTYNTFEKESFDCIYRSSNGIEPLGMSIRILLWASGF